MRRFVVSVALLALVGGMVLGGASATGNSPAGLTKAGWDCFNPAAVVTKVPNFNPTIHCFPPGQMERVFAGTASSALLKAFDTSDPNDDDAAFLGSERMLRADLYHGQPCPTDPPDLDPELRGDLAWSDLEPLFGLDYVICHTFDSPW